jgi:hypothetical protein
MTVVIVSIMIRYYLIRSEMSIVSFVVEVLLQETSIFVRTRHLIQANRLSVATPITNETSGDDHFGWAKDPRSIAPTVGYEVVLEVVGEQDDLITIDALEDDVLELHLFTFPIPASSEVAKIMIGGNTLFIEELQRRPETDPITKLFGDLDDVV